MMNHRSKTAFYGSDKVVDGVITAADGTTTADNNKGIVIAHLNNQLN